MRLNLYLRGIDLVDLELHVGSKGLYVDLSVFQPREGDGTPDAAEQATTADLSGSSGGSFDLAAGPVYSRPDTAVPGGMPPPDDDRGFGFQATKEDRA